MAIVPKADVFLEMDTRDQQQIVLAATGAIIDELVYKVQGKWGLSWAGINHIAFWMGDIKTDPGVTWERVQMFGDRIYWSATVRAINEKYNLASLGTAEVPEYKEVYDRDSKGNKISDGQRGFKKHLEPDPFCRRKALSMAQRNAKRAVIPEAVIKKWIQYFKDTKQGKTVEAPFKPKTIDADYTVGKTKKTTRKKKTSDIPTNETTQEDIDEKQVKDILTVNGLSLDDLDIYKYLDKIRVIPKPDFPQENFKEYNKTILKLLNAKWISAELRWDVSY